ncbi:hypothetical protein QYM36_014350, partial [Artemia franciscana]
MAVVARFWCPQLKRVCDRLLGLVEVPSATAQIMKGEVDKLLSVRNIPKENCIGFGWDDASVNMGEVTGLKALVKIDNPRGLVMDNLAYLEEDADRKMSSNSIPKGCPEIISLEVMKPSGKSLEKKKYKYDEVYVGTQWAE